MYMINERGRWYVAFNDEEERKEYFEEEVLGYTPKYVCFYKDGEEWTFAPTAPRGVICFRSKLQGLKIPVPREVIRDIKYPEQSNLQSYHEDITADVKVMKVKGTKYIVIPKFIYEALGKPDYVRLKFMEDGGIMVLPYQPEIKEEIRKVIKRTRAVMIRAPDTIYDILQWHINPDGELVWIHGAY